MSSRHSLSCRHFRRSVPIADKRFYAITNANGPELIEEQTLPRYSQKTYYPVRIRQQLIGRYNIIAKLGFGAYSTVWLAREERTNKYASVKVFIQDNAAASPVLNEIKTLQNLKNCPREHSGSSIARLPDDLFQLDGPTGQHHSEITRQNVLTQAANDVQFAAMEREEALDPSVPVMDNGYPVYRSRGQPRNILDLTGVAYLTDFGSAQLASSTHQDWWMPDTYRAPEVLMGVPWGFQVDVWLIGIMALELLEGRNFFDTIDKAHKQYVLPVAIAQYISVLGPPPLWMIQESESPSVPTFFDNEGRWISEAPIPKFSLENWVTALPAGEDEDKFIKFMRRILVWDSMQRGTSSELFLDEWQILSPCYLI
ncbi:kinase-like protein [Teratosphaeria nubilosa]|uniref:Kinase-like protein n=1 Tax=Teratosphaeria nubilosa TaxID=161662 RepID=A0A6G1L602_9PEZI|nr:kinase-like protein [Teratosphaeria nubilosa]